MAEFIYQEPFPIQDDKTKYRLLTKEYVKVVECDGRKILKVDPKGLELLSKEAYADVSFYLRAAHLQKLRNILEDPEATDNDKFVAYTMLLNQVVAAEGELPTCQDTGTAICIGHKGEDVWTGADDAECIARGVYETYKDRNLRYSQVVPFTMTDEKNSGTNLPAQIDISSSPRAAVRPTRPSSISRPRRCSTRSRSRNSSSSISTTSARRPARPTTSPSASAARRPRCASRR